MQDEKVTSSDRCKDSHRLEVVSHIHLFLLKFFFRFGCHCRRKSRSSIASFATEPYRYILYNWKSSASSSVVLSLNLFFFFKKKLWKSICTMCSLQLRKCKTIYWQIILLCLCHLIHDIINDRRFIYLAKLGNVAILYELMCLCVMTDFLMLTRCFLYIFFAVKYIAQRQQICLSYSKLNDRRIN